MPKTAGMVLTALIALPLATAMAAPMGYSVNSDQPSTSLQDPSGDQLFLIDLATGNEQLIGSIINTQGFERKDVEGLALDADGTLWGVDDETGKLFPVNKESALIPHEEERAITGFDAIQGNDFGLTFTCSGELYITSVKTRSLYLLGLDGTAEVVGNTGNLGANISAIAAIGEPATLYGLSNGRISEGGELDTRSLYRISTETGTASLIGPLGSGASDYFQAGLSFDANGDLWAITDRRTSQDNLGSELLRLDTGTGEATLISTTKVTGFESLAIASPAGCEAFTSPPPSPLDGTEYAAIPVLGPLGLALAGLSLLLTGLTALRRARA